MPCSQEPRRDSRYRYEDFLTLSKDADLDIPILQQAKAEYAKAAMRLQSLTKSGLTA